jgi:hypothetical protein
MRFSARRGGRTFGKLRIGQSLSCSHCQAHEWGFKFRRAVPIRRKRCPMLVETIDSEARLNRFNRLMQELIRVAA